MPKEIRDRLKLDPGTVLDFEVLPDGTLRVRTVRPDARRLRGLLKTPHARALTVEEMDAGVEEHVRSRTRPRKAPRGPGSGSRA